MSIFCKFSFPTFKSFNNWHFTQHLIYFFVFGNRVGCIFNDYQSGVLCPSVNEYNCFWMLNLCFDVFSSFNYRTGYLTFSIQGLIESISLSVFVYLIALIVTPCRPRHALACILSPWTFNVHCARAKWWDPGKVKDNTCHRFTLKSLWIFVLNQCIIAKFLSTLLMYLSLTNHRVLKLLSYTVNKRIN